jgi:predicted kinase
MHKPTLHFFCGKAASGKSTLAKKLAKENNAVLISEDIWLSRLYPNEINSLQDYIDYSRRLRLVVAPIVQEILERGLSVILDFPGNVPSQREWIRSVYENANSEHVLHFIDKPDETCKAQLKQRNNELPEGAKHLSDAEFDRITSYFSPPLADEGYNVVKHGH